MLHGASGVVLSHVWWLLWVVAMGGCYGLARREWGGAEPCGVVMQRAECERVEIMSHNDVEVAGERSCRTFVWHHPSPLWFTSPPPVMATFVCLDQTLQSSHPTSGSGRRGTKHACRIIRWNWSEVPAPAQHQHSTAAVTARPRSQHQHSTAAVTARSQAQHRGTARGHTVTPHGTQSQHIFTAHSHITQHKVTVTVKAQSQHLSSRGTARR